MAQSSQTAAELAKRARNVLLYEQQQRHEDRAVKTVGLQGFAANWAGQVRAARARGELAPPADGAALPPEEAFVHLLGDYRAQDPMQRVASVRAALALLDTIAPTHPTPGSGSMPAAAPAHVAPTNGAHRVARGGGTAPTVPARRDSLSPTSPTPSAALPAGVADPRGKPATAPIVSAPGVTDVTGPFPTVTPRPAAPARPEDEYLLGAPVTAVPGVGPTQEERLKRLGLRTVRDLLFHLPREHHDYSKLQKIAQLNFGEVSTILGLVLSVENVRTGKRGMVRTIAKVSDETGEIRAIWFNQSYLLKQIPRGAHIVLTGVKQRMGNHVELSVRSHELPEQGDLIHTGRLVPVYPLTEGLTPRVLRRTIKWAVDHCAGYLPEHLPLAIRSRARLMALPDAIAQMHFPENEHALAHARRRLAFDELFVMQLGMLTRRANWRDGPDAPVFTASPSLIFADVPAVEAAAGVASEAASASATEMELGNGLWPVTASCFEETLPFRFTGAQRRVLGEILGDLRRGQAMCRLLQGDVGSGKTVVAAAALLVAAANGYQGAMLAPTEILAEQHYRSVSALLAPFGLRVALLTGSQRAKERVAARDGLASGQVAIAIGTHALIQEGVEFKRLGLAVVDEQHRFGVEQRDALRQKGYNPHMLVMTATPIPRTLALTLYGDLDVSTIDELPSGRRPIITRWRHGAQQRHEAERLVASEVAAGRQAYIICPLVEESEALEAKAATKEFGRLKEEVFPDLRLGLVHGQLRPAEKERVMRSFRDGAIDVLVATAVVEVGVDVPNASIMLIEDADRFGLSQLHQFRGRVGRGAAQSYCYLLSQEASAQAGERLNVMERTTDGFALAEADLRLRGPGDFFGTRQSGLPELRVASLADTPLIAEARAQAEWLWQQDPYLKQYEHRQLRERVVLFWQEFVGH